MRANDLAIQPSSPVDDSPPDLPPADESVEALEEALEAARLRLQRRLADEIEHQRAESDRLKKYCEQIRAEAITMEEQAKETAARIVAEARQTEAQILDEAKRTVEAVQTRLRDGVGPLLERAATEIVAVQDAIGTGWPKPSTDQGSGASAKNALNPADERVVTRLIVRPSVAPDLRMRLKERIARLPGIDAALLGAVDEESFEILLAHEHEPSVLDSIVGMAPEQLLVTVRHEDRLELELAGVEWLRSPGEDPLQGQEGGAATSLAI